MSSSSRCVQREPAVFDKVTTWICFKSLPTARKTVGFRDGEALTNQITSTLVSHCGGKTSLRSNIERIMGGGSNSLKPNASANCRLRASVLLSLTVSIHERMAT